MKSFLGLMVRICIGDSSPAEDLLYETGEREPVTSPFSELKSQPDEAWTSADDPHAVEIINAQGKLS